MAEHQLVVHLRQEAFQRGDLGLDAGVGDILQLVVVLVEADRCRLGRVEMKFRFEEAVDHIRPPAASPAITTISR